MIVGSRNKLGKNNIYALRSKKSIDYAVNEIRRSPIAPFVEALYLYGSCARNEQSYRSDVDLFLELKSDFDAEYYKNDVILLKSAVTPGDMDMPEVDLKVVVGGEWKKNKMLYYQNIIKEGINIWKID